jgi:FkbM family methyltransferase
LHKPNLGLYRRYIQAFGLSGITVLRKIHFNPLQKQTKIISINLPGYLAPVYIRTGTSDRHIFTQIFVEKEYEFTSPDIHPKIIIDGGANVGFSSIYFAHEYPQAKIFAVEPEKSNFRMLVKNTRAYKRIIPVHAALWNRNCELYLRNEKSRKSAVQVNQKKEGTNERISGLTIEDLMKNAKTDHIDILKLDVEGSEKELFGCNFESWLNKVDMIAMELHDRFKEGCSDAFFEAIGHYSFGAPKKRGEILFLKRKL